MDTYVERWTWLGLALVGFALLSPPAVVVGLAMWLWLHWKQQARWRWIIAGLLLVASWAGVVLLWSTLAGQLVALREAMTEYNDAGTLPACLGSPALAGQGHHLGVAGATSFAQAGTYRAGRSTGLGTWGCQSDRLCEVRESAALPRQPGRFIRRGAMSAITFQHVTNWWAEGDTPVHADSQVAYLVDAHSTFLTMCRHFLMAQQYIYIAAWGMTPLMKLVRGTDQRAGPDSSPEQEALLAELRTEGLQQGEIDFWCSHDLTVQAVLGYAARKGVEVKVLIWSSFEPFSPFDLNAAHKHLTEVGVSCILDDSVQGLRHHPIESLHQKIAVVDGTHAFVGGIDMLIELSGDYDRWDTHFHHFSSPLRSNEEDRTPHNWHDAHAIVEGPAAGDVERNFRERWNDVVQRHKWDHRLLIPDHPLAPPVESTSQVQIARTIPTRTYSFTPKEGIQGIAQLYANALSNAHRFVYLENQYFWTHAYYTRLGLGVKLDLEASESPDMERNIRELADALRRGATLAMVLPDHPNVGRLYTDAGLTRLRAEAPEAAEEGRIQVFCLATSRTAQGRAAYRPIYVHAKVAIVDDLWSTVGSANLNNRGMRDDTEENVAALDAELARGLRMMLWAEHLELTTEERMLTVARHLGHQRQKTTLDERAAQVVASLNQTLGDPLAGLRLMVERAQDNLRRFKAHQPLIGHLLPYLTGEEAKRHGLNFHENHGWVEVQ